MSGTCSVLDVSGASEGTCRESWPCGSREQHLDGGSGYESPPDAWKLKPWGQMWREGRNDLRDTSQRVKDTDRRWRLSGALGE